MKKILLICLLPFVFIAAVQAQTNVPALITSSQTWTPSGSPYIIGQNTFIDTGVTVKIMPGVEVQSSSSYTLYIDGEVQALGTWDSIIYFSKVKFEFSTKSKDYNPSTGRGAYFNYCNFTGNGSGTTTISTKSTALKVDNSVFSNSYYSIYPYNIGYDSSLITVTNSKFSGDNYNEGSPLYGVGTYIRWYVANNTFTNARQNYVYGSIIFKNNTLRNMKKTNFYVYGNSEISCNRFQNMAQGVYISTMSTSKNCKLLFSKNTIDSAGGLYDPMLKVDKNSSASTYKVTLEMSDNNFLKNSGSMAKVVLNAYNGSPTKTDTVNFKNNFWGSNDSATIEGYITDYNDNINIYGRVNFKGFYSAPQVNCSYNNACAIANFTFNVKDSIVAFSDKSYGSNKYQIKWKFGDGNSNDSNKSTIVHHYAKAGNYYACMYVYDTTSSLCDSMCKAVEIKSNTKCKASYYFAVDTADNKIIYVVNTSTGTNSKTQYYWTFGDASGSTSKNPTHSYSSTGNYQLCLTIFDTAAGCYSTYCDSVQITNASSTVVALDGKDILNMKTVSKDYGVQLFPNPSNGELHVKWLAITKETVQILVYNSKGQLVTAENKPSAAGINEAVFHLNALPSGIYWIRLHTNSFSQTDKLILEN